MSNPGFEIYQPDYNEPVTTETADIIWDRLPAHFKDQDPKEGWVMKRYMGSVGDVLDEFAQLNKRIDYIPPEDGGDYEYVRDNGSVRVVSLDSSALADPQKADREWLPWIGQVMGVKDVPAHDKGRGMIQAAGASYMLGTASSIEAAAQSDLIGDRYVKYYPRKKWMPGDVNVSDGTEWEGLIVTRDSETLKNLMPETLATTANPRDFSSVDGSDAVLSLSSDKTDDFYNNTFLRVDFRPITSMSNEVGYALKKILLPTSEVTSGDPLNVMVKVRATIGSGRFTVRGYYTNNQTLVGTTFDIGTYQFVDNQAHSLFYSAGIVPSGANSLVLEFYFSGFSVGNIYDIGEFGLRKEDTPGWVPVSANPVQSVIDRGAKPAGLKLYHMTFASNWNTLETNLPTWADWEGQDDWVAIEEQR